MTPGMPQPAAAGINQSAVKGEPGTGYENGDGKGAFECGNCSHFSSGSCNQPDMVANSQQPKNGDGTVQVDEDGCCEYVDRVGGTKDTDQGSEQAEGSPDIGQLQAKFKPGTGGGGY